MANTKFKVRNGLFSQNLTFSDSVENPTHEITFDMLATDKLSIAGDNANFVIDDSTGRIGIGTDSPDSLLHVSGGSITLDGTNEINHFSIGSSYTFLRAAISNQDLTLIRVADAASGSSALDSAAYGFSIKYMGSRATNDNSLSIFSDNENTGPQVEALTILQDGKIGINHASPVEQLEIGGNLNVGFADENVNRTIKIYSSDTNNRVAALSMEGGTFVINGGIANQQLELGRSTGSVYNTQTYTINNNGSPSYFAWRDGTDEIMRLEEGGNLGIGTNDPDKLLVVRGAGAEIVINDTDATDTPRLRFRESGSTSGTISTDGSTMIFTYGSSETEALRINGTTGDVSISSTSASTTTATGALTVAGGAGFGDTIFVEYATDGTYASLDGAGLRSNRGTFYIQPIADATQSLIFGASDDSLDWSSIILKSSGDQTFRSGANNTLVVGNTGITVGGTITTTGAVTVGGNISGSLPSTNSTGTLLRSVVSEVAVENGGHYDPAHFNILAGSNKRFTCSGTMAGSPTTVQGNMFLGDSSFSTYTFANSTDELVITITGFTTALYTAYIGITFGNLSFRAKDVKIETFRNGAWQTECDLVEQSAGTIVRQIANNNNLGVSQVRYTLKNPSNAGGSVRINNLFMCNYNISRIESGYDWNRFGSTTAYGAVSMLDNTTSTTSTTGALTVAGGVGIAENLNVAGNIAKDGGLSTEFLKADGSVDSTTYIPKILVDDPAVDYIVNVWCGPTLPGTGYDYEFATLEETVEWLNENANNVGAAFNPNLNSTSRTRIVITLEEEHAFTPNPSQLRVEGIKTQLQFNSGTGTASPLSMTSINSTTLQFFNCDHVRFDGNLFVYSLELRSGTNCYLIGNDTLYSFAVYLYDQSYLSAKWASVNSAYFGLENQSFAAFWGGDLYCGIVENYVPTLSSINILVERNSTILGRRIYIDYDNGSGGTISNVSMRSTDNSIINISQQLVITNNPATPNTLITVDNGGTVYLPATVTTTTPITSNFWLDRTYSPTSSHAFGEYNKLNASSSGVFQVDVAEPDYEIRTGLAISSSDSSTTTASGALTVAGGVGIGENLNVGGNASVEGEIFVGVDGTTPGSITLYNDTTETLDPKIFASSFTGGITNDLELKTFSTNGSVVLSTNGGGDIIFAPGSATEKVRIDNNGKVGIGTGSTVDTTLHVKSAGVNGILLDADTGDSTLSSRLFFETGTGTSGIVGVNGDLSFRRGMIIDNTTGTETVNIDGTTGNVSIASDVAINGGDLTTTATTFNLIDTTATTLNIGGAATTVNIGADTGTTTVHNDLTVDGNLTVSGTTTTVNTTNLDVQDAVLTLNKGQATPLNDIGILLQRYASATSTNYNVGIVWDEATDRLIFGKTPEDGSDNDVSFNTEWMTIKDTGNVGIGTNDPQAPLHLFGTDGETIRFGVNNTVYGKLSSGFAGARFDVTGANGGFGMAFSMDDDTKMTLLPNGNFGVGETNPDTRLEVKSSANTQDGGIRLTDTNGTIRGNLYFGGAQNFVIHGASSPVGEDAPALQFATGGSTPAVRMTILEEGNVGINVIDPDVRLTVEETQDTVVNILSNGTYAARFTSTVSGDTGRSQGILLSGNASNTRGVALIAEAQSAGNDHDLIIATSASGSTPTERVRVDSAGNVSISADLVVDTDTLFVNSTNNTVSIGTPSALTPGGTAKLSVISSSVALSFGVSNTDMSYVRRIGVGEYQWQTYAGGNSGQIQLQPYGGDVGIGTVEPSAKLDVAGDIEVNSQYTLNAETATLATVTQTQIASYAVATFGGAKIVIQATRGSERHMTELLVVHDGTTASSTEYASIYTGAAPLATYDVDISGGNVRVLATSASATSTVYKVAETLMFA